MGDLVRMRLGDIVTINTSSYGKKDNWNYVNYLDTGNITEDVVSEIQYIDLSTEKLPSRAKRKVKFNDIIFSTVRPNQRHYGIIKSQPENFLVSTGFAVISVNKEKADADYIFYLLSQDNVVESLHAIAEQSTSAYPSIKPSDIEEIEINLPSIKTQRKIASILNAFKDKISINKKINDNLVA